MSRVGRQFSSVRGQVTSGAALIQHRQSPGGQGFQIMVSNQAVQQTLHTVLSPGAIFRSVFMGNMALALLVYWLDTIVYVVIGLMGDRAFPGGV